MIETSKPANKKSGSGFENFFKLGFCQFVSDFDIRISDFEMPVSFDLWNI